MARNTARFDGAVLLRAPKDDIEAWRKAAGKQKADSLASWLRSVANAGAQAATARRAA